MNGKRYLAPCLLLAVVLALIGVGLIDEVQDGDAVQGLLLYGPLAVVMTVICALAVRRGGDDD